MHTYIHSTKNTFLLLLIFIYIQNDKKNCVYENVLSIPVTCTYITYSMYSK